MRDYQQEQINGINAQLEVADSTLVVSPTGTGKTVVMAGAIQQNQWRAMVIAHREELVFQNRDTIQAVLGSDHEVTVEMGEFRAVGSTGLIGNPTAVVATVQSLHANRLERFSPHNFSVLIVDEGHHCTKATKTYNRVVEYFQQNPQLKVCGFTATPDRADEVALGEMFQTIAADYQLNQAIDDGWLVPISQQMVHVEGLDLSCVKTRMGDLAGNELDAIMAEEEMCHQVVGPTMEIVGSKRTLVFCSGVAQAHRTAEIFNRHRHGCAVAIDGKTPREVRRELLAQYSRGEIQFICNCAVFLEGFDEPGIEAVVQARPTKSRSLYAQIIGRGTRVLPDVIEGYRDGEHWRLETPDERKLAVARSIKPRLTVIDFVGNAGKHSLIYAADILGGIASDEVVERANDIAKDKGERGEPIEVDEALLQATHQIEDERKQRRAKVIAAAKYTLRPVDPFDVFDQTYGREPGYFRGKQPTEGQLKALQKFKVPVTRHMGEWWIADDKTKKKDWVPLSFWKAKRTLDVLIDRIKANKCSFAQARVLAKYGENTECEFKEASQIIDEIAKGGWKPRDATVEKLAALAEGEGVKPTWEKAARRSERKAATQKREAPQYDDIPF